jgi:hypothetical protein
MARIRTIKPDFWSDDTVGELSFAARLLFIGCWNFADDHGNLERSAKQLKAQVFPHDVIDCEPVVRQLIDAGLLFEYEGTPEGKSPRKYLHIKGFADHQKVERRGAPRFPLPEASPTAHRILTDTSPSAHRLLEVSSLEGKGREGKVTEGKSATRSPERARACEAEDAERLEAWHKLHGEAPDTPPLEVEVEVEIGEREAWSVLERVKAAYPAGVYLAADWILAERHLRNRLAEGIPPDELIAGCARYAAQCVARECGTRFVRSPKDFFASPADRWREPYPLPTEGARRGKKTFDDYRREREEREVREAEPGGEQLSAEPLPF